VFCPYDSCDFNSYFRSPFYATNWPRNCIAVSIAELDSATFYPVLFFREIPNSLPFPYRISYRIGTLSDFIGLDRGRSRFKTQPDGHCWFLRSHSVRSELPISVLAFLFLSLSFCSLLSSYFPQLSYAFLIALSSSSSPPPSLPFFLSVASSPVSTSPYTDFLLRFLFGGILILIPPLLASFRRNLSV